MSRIPRKDWEAREKRNAEWRKLHRQGLSYAEIGRRYGCHHTVVMYALKVEWREQKQEQMRWNNRLHWAAIRQQREMALAIR